MEAQSKSSNLHYKLFHVLHVFTAVLLMVVVFRNQVLYEARIKELENYVGLLKQISRTRDTKKQMAENSQATMIYSYDTIVKRSLNNEHQNDDTEGKRNKNLRKQGGSDLTNSTSFIIQKHQDVMTCIDLVEKFLKVNDMTRRKAKSNECKILRGAPGKPGRRGRRGKIGPKGRAGDKGNIGKHGPPGPRGQKGFSGNVTVIGLKGDMGPKGTKGDRGDTGMKGQKGIQGPKGEYGGQKGEQGKRGENGEVGPRGCPGDTFAPPTFPSSPRYLVFKERHPAVLSCKATANPYPHVTWYRDNERISSIKDSSKDRYEVKEEVFIPTGLNRTSCFVNRHPVTESSLVIKQSRSNDTGSYTCEARNIMGVFTHEIRLLIQVYVEFTSLPLNITVVENSDVQLRCRASGVPSPLITWHRKDGDVMPNRSRIVQGDLNVTGITKEQEGSYVCVASNVLGAKSTETTITVNVFPVIQHFYEHLVIINENQTLTLPCNATGYPTPSVNWYKSNDSLPQGRYTFDSQILNIYGVQYEDRGEYVCTAKNTVETVSKRTTVIIQVGPKVRRKPKDLEYALQGKSKVLHFEVFAFPDANVTWKRLDNMKLDERFRQQAGNLVIEKVQYTDAGFYQATARNILGEVKVTTFLVTVGFYLKIFVQSEGCDDSTVKDGCGTCIIRVNNVDYCPNTRGHNIVVFNKFGDYQKKGAFDTHGDSAAGRKMKTFLDGLPNESIVVIAIQDSGGNHVGDAETALRSVGAVNPLDVSLRSSWLLVGCKGSSPSWITERRADRYKGPSQATVTITNFN